MLKCNSCGKEIPSQIEFDPANFIVYCPECGMKQARLEILKLHPEDRRPILEKQAKEFIRDNPDYFRV